MSPLWRDEIGVFLGPTKVVLARMKKGVRPKCVADAGATVVSKDPGDWQPSIDALRAAIDDPAWQDANVRIVISDQWTRYAELPWSTALASSAERESYARHIMLDLYGDVAENWSITLSRVMPGRTTIVSATPTSLITELQSLFAARGQTVLSLQPHLLSAFNAWRDKLPAQAAWFAAIDDGMLAALHITDGRCDRVRAVRISGNWAAEVRRMQTMGRMARGNPAEGPVFVDAPIWVRESAETGDTALEWLRDCSEPTNIAHKVTLLKGLYA